MLTFIPNITDESFTNADSNKALMKKFFGLQTSQQEAIKALQKQQWIPVTEESVIQAGYEGREVRFRLHGRLFAIRELAQ